MDKKENKRLMEFAQQALTDNNGNNSNECPLFKDAENGIIYDSYNGQIAALGVSILMIGLKPTIAVYYQDEPKADTAYRRGVLEVIARMLSKCQIAGITSENFNDAKSLTRFVLSQEDILKTNILNCSVALKQIVRTYKLEE